MQLNRRSVRFRPPGQSGNPAWTVFQVEGSDCLLFVHPEAQRRRLTPVPLGWEQLGPAGLADLLERATPAPVHLMPKVRKRAPEPALVPVQEIKDDRLALEREQRLMTEQLLSEAQAALKGMERDLESANAELRTMNEELQEMTKAMKTLAPSTPPTETGPTNDGGGRRLEMSLHHRGGAGRPRRKQSTGHDRSAH